ALRECPALASVFRLVNLGDGEELTAAQVHEPEHRSQRRALPEGLFGGRVAPAGPQHRHRPFTPVVVLHAAVAATHEPDGAGGVEVVFDPPHTGTMHPLSFRDRLALGEALFGDLGALPLAQLPTEVLRRTEAFLRSPRLRR